MVALCAETRIWFDDTSQEGAVKRAQVGIGGARCHFSAKRFSSTSVLSRGGAGASSMEQNGHPAVASGTLLCVRLQIRNSQTRGHTADAASG